MKYYLLAATALSLSSCLRTEPDSCRTTLITPVLSATGPKTVAVNAPAVFNLSYQMANGCGTLDAPTQQTSSNTQLVGLNVTYNTCTCATAAPVSQTTYTFQPTQAGTYLVKFVSLNGYLTDTLVAK